MILRFLLDVLKEFATKKCVKLGKLLKERGGVGLGMELNRKALPTASNLNPELNSKSENCSSVTVIKQNSKTQNTTLSSFL